MLCPVWPHRLQCVGLLLVTSPRMRGVWITHGGTFGRPKVAPVDAQQLGACINGQQVAPGDTQQLGILEVRK